MSSSSARYHSVPNREASNNMDIEASTPRRIARRPVPQPPTSPNMVSPVSPHSEHGISAYSLPPLEYTTDVDYTGSNRGTLYSDKIHVPSSDADGSDASKLVAQPTGRDKIYVPFEQTEYYAKGTSTSVSDGMQPITNTSTREKIPNPGIPWGEDAGLIPVYDKKRKRIWMILGAVGVILIIVGAVLGGVFGSKAKSRKGESSKVPSDT